jgi:hypothetical protein
LLTHADRSAGPAPPLPRAIFSTAEVAEVAEKE